MSEIKEVIVHKGVLRQPPRSKTTFATPKRTSMGNSTPYMVSLAFFVTKATGGEHETHDWAAAHMLN